MLIIEPNNNFDSRAINLQIINLIVVSTISILSCTWHPDRSSKITEEGQPEKTPLAL